MQPGDATKDSGNAVVTSLTEKEKKKQIKKLYTTKIFKSFLEVSGSIEDGVDQNKNEENANDEGNMYKVDDTLWIHPEDPEVESKLPPCQAAAEEQGKMAKNWQVVEEVEGC